MLPFILIIIITAFVFYNLLNLEVKYVESMIDNKKYLVQDKTDSKTAADMLAQLRINMNKLIDYCNENINTDECINFKKYIIRLDKRNKDGIIFSESNPESNYTSYSVNKGEELVFCLRSKEDGSFHDINLIMYVMVHEISHIACPEYGHTPLFNKIFAFLLNLCIKIKLYKKIDFDNNPTEYCGMTVTSSII